MLLRLLVIRGGWYIWSGPSNAIKLIETVKETGLISGNLQEIAVWICCLLLRFLGTELGVPNKETKVGRHRWLARWTKKLNQTTLQTPSSYPQLTDEYPPRVLPDESRADGLCLTNTYYSYRCTIRLRTEFIFRRIIRLRLQGSTIFKNKKLPSVTRAFAGNQLSTRGALLRTGIYQVECSARDVKLAYWIVLTNT